VTGVSHFGEATCTSGQKRHSLYQATRTRISSFSGITSGTRVFREMTRIVEVYLAKASMKIKIRAPEAAWKFTCAVVEVIGYVHL
jgi:hypothetical protein